MTMCKIWLLKSSVVNTRKIQDGIIVFQELPERSDLIQKEKLCVRESNMDKHAIELCQTNIIIVDAKLK